MTSDLYPLEHIKWDLYSGPVVYLIHLHQPLRHARHYVGWTRDLAARMNTHARGTSDSSHYMRAVHRAGISWTLVRVWQFDSDQAARDFERLWKTRRLPDGRQIRAKYHTHRACPYCRDQALERVRDAMRDLRRRRRKKSLDAEERNEKVPRHEGQAVPLQHPQAVPGPV